MSDGTGLPSDIQAEQEVLGALLVDNYAIGQVAGLLEPTDFFIGTHRAVYAAMLALHERGQPTDIGLVRAELDQRGDLEEVGGVSKLVEWLNATPTAMHAVHYASVVADRALRRRLIQAGGRIATLAYEAPTGQEAAEQATTVLAQSSVSRAIGRIADFAALVEQVWDETVRVTDAQAEGEVIEPGLSTGLVDLDQRSGGMRPGELVLLAARPSMGKTSMAMQIATTVAGRGKRVLVFSLEMGGRDVAARALWQHARLNGQEAQRGMLDAAGMEKLAEAMGEMAPLPIRIDDTAGLPVAALVSRARAEKAERGVDLVVVDYLQLLKGPPGGRPTGWPRSPRSARPSRPWPATWPARCWPSPSSTGRSNTARTRSLSCLICVTAGAWSRTPIRSGCCGGTTWASPSPAWPWRRTATAPSAPSVCGGTPAPRGSTPSTRATPLDVLYGSAVDWVQEDRPCTSSEAPRPPAVSARPAPSARPSASSACSRSSPCPRPRPTRSWTTCGRWPRTAMATASVVRGCGSRQPGGVYLVTALGERGVPLEACVVDPPVPIDAVATGLSPQGMALASSSKGTTVVMDWVGTKSYPNVADYVEETALFGSSRRIPANFDFARLGPGSRHVLVHPRAIVTNRQWLVAHASPWSDERSLLGRLRRRRDGIFCPFKPQDHPATAMCAAYWWEVLLPGTVVFDADPAAFDEQCERERTVQREMPAFSYEGYTLPDRDIWVPQFALGAFLALPISRIEVVSDPGDMAHVENLARAAKSQLPVVEVPE